MDLHDRAVAALDPQVMRGEQNVGPGEASGSVEFPARKLDQEPERVLEIDGVEDHSVAHPSVGDARAASRSTICMKTARDTLNAM